MKQCLQYFFTYETQLPNGVGFPLFGLRHILWLLGIALLCILFLKSYAKGDAKKRRRMECLSAFSMILWIGLRAIYIGVLQEPFLYELPLHLCSMTGILCALHCVTGWEWLGQVLYAIGLPGTILALLFPNWSFYPAIHFITVEGFLFHMGIVMYVCCMLYSHRIVPQLSKLWQVVVFLVSVVTPIYFFNKHFGTNYMFVNWPSEGSPLVILAHFLGNPGYLVGYAALIALCIFLMDAGYAITTRKKVIHSQ